MAHHCEPLYRQRKYRKLLRIEWFLDYLYDVLYIKLGEQRHKLGDEISSIAKLRDQAQADYEQIVERQKEREAQSLQELLIIVAPLAASIPPAPLVSFPSQQTEEERERFLNEYGPLL